MHIRPAELREHHELTRIALAAKSHWGYPDAWIELWRDELAYTPDRFATEEIFVVEDDGRVVGVGSISFHQGEAARAEIEGLWVLPEAMGRGVGRMLVDRAVDIARGRGVTHLVIVSDPGAVGFYERLGARRVGTTPSRPAGRELPRFELEV